MGRRLPQIMLAVALAAAAVSGGLVAVSLGAGQQAQITTTINVATGPQGPTVPQGPAGGTTCPAGFREGVVVVNHPGGQTRLFTCVGG